MENLEDVCIEVLINDEMSNFIFAFNRTEILSHFFFLDEIKGPIKIKKFIPV